MVLPRLMRTVGPGLNTTLVAPDGGPLTAAMVAAAWRALGGK